ncbi:MAG: DUF1015 family protein [Myxococcota bacterium]
MADVRPFYAVCPRNDDAAGVIAPPYDVLSESEARRIARERRSFVRVTRSEVDLPAGTDPHAAVTYAKARENLDSFLEDGLLEISEDEIYLFYGQRMGEHTQVGILAGASVQEYDDGDIAKHEFTRPDKEDDRTHHMEVLDAQVGLVFLAYRPTAALDALTAEITAAPPEWSVTTSDGVVHTLWRAPVDRVDAIRAAFADVPRLYIADGHHRSAAASRVYANRKDERSAYFLAGLYPSDRLMVMAYNRVVHDLHGRTPEAFLDAVRERWTVEPVDGESADTPAAHGDFRMYLGGAWYRLVLKPEHVRADDPVACLDVAALQDHLLEPLLGIDDPRRSTRIDFVGGIHGPAELAKRVDGGRAVAFHLFPTSLEQLFAVADAGEVMPPKSTWFEPKLREGVAIRLLGR